MATGGPRTCSRRAALRPVLDPNEAATGSVTRARRVWTTCASAWTAGWRARTTRCWTGRCRRLRGRSTTPSTLLVGRADADRLADRDLVLGLPGADRSGVERGDGGLETVVEVAVQIVDRDAEGRGCPAGGAQSGLRAALQDVGEGGGRDADLVGEGPPGGGRACRADGGGYGRWECVGDRFSERW